VLIADSLFRSKNIETRKKYVQMVEKAEKQGGVNCVIFSSQNLSGARLEGMTGVACILRYALPELELMEDDGEDDMDEGGSEVQEEEESKDQDDTQSQVSFDQLKLEELLNGAGDIGDYGEEDEQEGEEEEEKMMVA